MPPTTHLRSLQALELALRTGSLKAAAERLRITPAAVGQRIRTLEDWLGLDLLVRGRSGIHPTAELRKALEPLARAFNDLDKVTELLDFQRVDEVHVVADPDFESLWLRPRLPGFRRDHPNVLLCINGIGDVPLRLGQADCRIWLGPLEVGEDTDRLFADYLLPVISPMNAARIGKMPRRTRLDGFPLLHLAAPAGEPAPIDWPRWLEEHGGRTQPAGRGMLYTRLTHAAEAAVANAGALLCGIVLMLDEIEAGRLVFPFPVTQGSWREGGYQADFRRDSARRAAVRQFRSWLASEAAATEARLKATVAAPPAGAGRRKSRDRAARRGPAPRS